MTISICSGLKRLRPTISAAFGSIGLVGLFKTFKFNERKLVFQEIFLGVFFVLAVAFRLLFATLSGVILWNTKFFASLAYNAGYILPSGGIVDIALLVENAYEFTPVSDFNSKNALCRLYQHVLPAVERVIYVENDSPHRFLRINLCLKLG